MRGAADRPAPGSSDEHRHRQAPASRRRPGGPDGEIELQEPPLMAEEAPPDYRSFAMIVPMGLGMGGMMMMFGMYQRSPIMYVMGGGMAAAMLVMGVVQ